MKKTSYSKNVLVYQTPEDVSEAVRDSLLYQKTHGRDYWSIEILEGEAHGTYHGFRDRKEAEKYAKYFERYNWKPTING